MTDLFIAPDARSVPCIWDGEGNAPRCVLTRDDVRHAPEVWAILAAAIPEGHRLLDKPA